ncbi:hypothetical protein HOD20_02555 [archaeon]|jgi:hypothetical protein|nr:hypothetical protein [archaeon]MBT4351387.1 hypothetical protein [archaeon]MBT4646872.1 hypothetical protein [archaeon]MBT6822117.1 hypothetical protein [archaeon]MBT7392606.1 hypothetical protein [archaeon]
MKLELFKPTKSKTIITLIVLVLWYFIIGVFFRPMCKCAVGGFEGCVNYDYLALVHPHCHCSCISLSTAIFSNIIFILPPILFYIIYSFIEYNKTKKN